MKKHDRTGVEALFDIFADTLDCSEYQIRTQAKEALHAAISDLSVLLGHPIGNGTNLNDGEVAALASLRLVSLGYVDEAPLLASGSPSRLRSSKRG